MYSLLLLNGGIGARVGAGQPKQLLKVRGIPILVYSLVAVDRIEGVTQIVLNYPPGWKEAVEEILEAYAIRTPVTLVEAGDTRHASVAVMLPHCENDHVIVHEAARPLVSEEDFERLIASEYENVSLMLPIPFTVAPVDPATHEVTGSLERDRLRNVQLPQKFNKTHLASAHTFASERDEVFTEDATLVAVAGHPVHFIDGTDRNFKVTTPIDVRLATYLLQSEEAEDE
ncbi:2-C-methyl-D-erythritol 4-phosphate cytidylyltransferase [Pseudactinotalea sp. HY158]|uniref:IspD/TarI family cytidylyltransferase n=1 Tax=Pseudactinotalea sp. HY158 TaxID=2654547 RepID=UPI00129C3D2A|nr:IspD/TarI family cytidylyltransferase [Pseudactinotalea sp. HY158]QGH70080.1 NTP transferase domain-containing protein [Pseudactinotalea sp. HY158]